MADDKPKPGVVTNMSEAYAEDMVVFDSMIMGAIKVGAEKGIAISSMVGVLSYWENMLNKALFEGRNRASKEGSEEPNLATMSSINPKPC